VQSVTKRFHSEGLYAKQRNLNSRAPTTDKDKTTPVRYDGPGSSRWAAHAAGKRRLTLACQFSGGTLEGLGETLACRRHQVWQARNGCAIAGTKDAPRPPGGVGGHNAPGIGRPVAPARSRSKAPRLMGAARAHPDS
jgi:hypothetical protein